MAVSSLQKEINPWLAVSRFDKNKAMLGSFLHHVKLSKQVN
jgi:hypothetical protein